MKAGHRGDRGERLPPEAEGADPFDGPFRRELARRVALDRELEIVRWDPPAIVGDLHPLEPSARETDRHVGGARVHGVLDELLHDGRRAFHDLARSDPLDRFARELADRRT